MEHFNLDDHIKKALEHFEAPFQEDHWSLMEESLNDSANADLSEDPTDHAIREKLTQLNPKAEAAHWDAMAAKLAALSTEPLLEDALVDGVAYENLKDLNAPYQEAHWDLMEQKIKEELTWKNKVVRYKLVELSLVFLFLFTFMQYWPDAKVILPKLIKRNQVETPKQNITPAEKVEESEIELNEVVEKAPIVFNEETAEQVNALDQTTINTTTKLTPVFAEANINEFKTNASFVEAEQNSGAQQLEELNVTQADLLALNQIDNIQTGLLANNNESTVGLDWQILDPLANISLALLDVPETVFPFNKKGIKKDASSYFRVGVTGGGTVDFYSQKEAPKSSLNRIRQFVDLSSVRTYEFGHGGGVTIGFKKNRLEFETGAIYGTKQIIADTISLLVNEVSLVNGITGTGWVGSKMDLLQVPMNLRYDFMDKLKWKMYTQGGMTFNMILNSIDRYQEVQVEEPKNLRLPIEDELDGKTNSRNNSVANTNNDGIGSGGSFTDNAYFNLDLGLGLERQFSSRYSMFLQTSYHQYLGLTGIKNTGLQLSSLRIQTGFKVSLKRKAQPAIQ